VTDAAGDLGFVHRFEPGGGRADGRALLLLHGTGGDEGDLLALGRELLPGAALLSPRGRVLERGMPRFFRRLAEGVFDLEDLVFRANELADFVARAVGHYGLQPSSLVAAGYSNGANIAGAVLLLRPEAFGEAVLLRPMVPLEPAGEADLAGKRVLLLSGAADPIAPPAHMERLAALLRERGAAVDGRVLPAASHALTPADLDTARAWLAP
jgi:predicted esterase